MSGNAARPCGTPCEERAIHDTTVSLHDLVNGTEFPIDGECHLELPDYVEGVVASGLPGLRALPSRARREALDGYLDRVVDRDFTEQGLTVRKPTTLRNWMQAHAAATSSTARYQTILDAATPGESDKPARSTVTAYRDVLQRLWLLDPVPGWTPVRNELTRLQQAPKHHRADPGLAARLLRLSASGLLGGVGPAPGHGADTMVGALFESLATLCVRVAAQAAEAHTYHLRSRDGDHEIDLIVERDDRKVVALEVKLAGTVTDRDVSSDLAPGTPRRRLRRRCGAHLWPLRISTTGRDRRRAARPARCVRDGPRFARYRATREPDATDPRRHWPTNSQVKGCLSQSSGCSRW